MRNTRCKVLASCALLLLCSALAGAPARAAEAVEAGSSLTGPAPTGPVTDPAGAPSGSRNPQRGSRSSESTTPGLSLEMTAGKERVYLREPVSLTVTLLAGPEAPRNIEYPRLKSPGLLVGEFGLPRQVSVIREGRELTAYQFTTTVTPTRSGSLRIGAAELGCETLAPASGPAAFFGGTEARRVTARSNAVPLTVLPLPVRGRPAGFSGAVGRFTLTRTARPTAVLAGDPVTVRTVVRGSGNIQSFSCNPAAGSGLQSYPPHRELRGGVLTCEQVVIPDSPAVREIPPARLDFFDPEKERYQTAVSGPVPLRVSTSPTPAPLASPRTTAPLLHPPPSSQPVIALPVVIVAGLSIAGVILLFRRHCQQLAIPATIKNVPPAEIQLQLAAAKAALGTGDVDILYTAIFRALQTFTGNWLSLPPAGITGSLPQENLASPVYQSARHIFRQCDRVRYGKHMPDATEMAADLQRLLEVAGTSST